MVSNLGSLPGRSALYSASRVIPESLANCVNPAHAQCPTRLQQQGGVIFLNDRRQVCSDVFLAAQIFRRIKLGEFGYIDFFRHASILQ